MHCLFKRRGKRICRKGRKLSPKELKRGLMGMGYPESSTRSMVHEIKAARQGVLFYDEEEDDY